MRACHAPRAPTPARTRRATTPAVASSRRHTPQPKPAPATTDSPLLAARKSAAALAAAALVSLGATGDAMAAVFSGPAPTPTTTITSPVDPAKLAVQRTMVEAWDAVARAYVDGPTFHGRDWRAALNAGLQAAADAPDARRAYGAISAMLDKLGDPYTRIVSPDEYAAFRVSSDGELQGVGLLIASDPASDRLVVLSPIEGGPAARAGIRPGDRVLSIDGADTAGMDRDNAAARLRGSSGSSVMLRIATRADAVDAPTPGVARRPAVRAVRLTRERVELSPVTSALLTPPAMNTRSPPPPPIGYVRLAAFTARAGADVRSAVTRLSAAGAQAFILDLRDNPGGLVRSGLDVASLWLRGGAPVFSVTGRGDGAAPAVLQRVVLPDDMPAESLTTPPLAVLVDGGSASAAEIVAGALHDNKRATLVGPSHTYGKGKIQTVYPLQDGSALFVTVARYVTPGNHVIDGRGVAPDTACRPRRGGGPSVFDGGAPRLAAALPGMAALIEASLDEDPCVQAAEGLLLAKTGKQQQQA